MSNVRVVLEFKSRIYSENYQLDIYVWVGESEMTICVLHWCKPNINEEVEVYVMLIHFVGI